MQWGRDDCFSLVHLRKSHSHRREAVTHLSFWHAPGPVRKGRRGLGEGLGPTSLAWLCEASPLEGGQPVWPPLVLIYPQPHWSPGDSFHIQQFIFHFGALSQFDPLTVLGLFSVKLGEVEAGTASQRCS